MSNLALPLQVCRTWKLAMYNPLEPFICSHELRSTLNRQSIDNPVLAQKIDPASPLNFHLRRITVARQLAAGLRPSHKCGESQKDSLTTIHR
jgi:hypothetical protein